MRMEGPTPSEMGEANARKGVVGPMVQKRENARSLVQSFGPGRPIRHCLLWYAKYTFAGG